MSKKLEKICCEICNERNKKILEYHHIIERTESECTNDPMNLAVICPNCHTKNHSGVIKICGIVPSTKMPYGRTVIYEENGIRNVNVTDEELDWFRPKPKTMKI